ncbi:MAG: hypothetical protein JNM50_04835 [Chromatiales bacterium]|jgi:hypothetical protein|nr:hypothetical protein [Chromatiales bacterium]
MVRTTVLAVLAGTLLGSTISTLVVAALDPGTRGTLIANVIWLASFGPLIAMPVAFIYGLPVYALLKRRGIASIYTATFAGALPGLALLLYEADRSSGAGVAVGVCIGVAFHSLARHAADKTRQPTGLASGSAGS